MVRHPVAGPRLEGIGHGGGAGKGPSHHRTMGGGLWCGRAQSPDIRADRWFPPALGEAQREELRAAVQQLPAAAGLDLANWNWKVVHRFVWERFGLSLCRSSCLTYLRRLGFAFKRPKKRLLKADEEKREAFVAAYAALREEAVGSGAKIFFADEAHFRADAELRGRWVLRGEPALVNSSSPRYGEKASYYSAVCLETGEVEWMDLEGNSNSGTSFWTRREALGPLQVIWDNAPAHRGEAVREYLVEWVLRFSDLEGRSCNSNSGTSAAFLDQLRQRHSGPLQVIWDNAPAHRGEAVREYLRRPAHPPSHLPGAEAGESAGLQPRLQRR